MKITITLALLSLITFFAYWLLTDSKNDQPNVVFTSSFSMDDVEFPKLEVSEKIIPPTLGVTAEIIELVDIVVTPTTQIQVSENELSKLEQVFINEKYQSKKILNLHDESERKLYFIDLININLKKIAVKNSHAIFEGIDNHAFGFFEVSHFIKEGIDQAYTKVIKKELEHHYQGRLQNIKTICGQQWCNAMATMPVYTDIKIDYCKGTEFTSWSCQEKVLVKKNEAYFQALIQHNRDCDSIYETEYTGFDDQGNSIHENKFYKILETKVKNCRRDTSKIDVNFERQLVMKVKNTSTDDIILQPLMVEEIPLVTNEFDNLQPQMEKVIRSQLQGFNVVDLESLHVECASEFCNVKFSSQIPYFYNDTKIDLFLDYVSMSPFCEDTYGSVFYQSWSDGDEFQINDVDFKCVLPENYELYL